MSPPNTAHKTAKNPFQTRAFEGQDTRLLRQFDALAVPGRPRPIPDFRDMDVHGLAILAVRNGLEVGVRENALALGHPKLADALRHSSQRRFFLARRHQAVAEAAIHALYNVLPDAPIALGALAAADRIHGRMDLRALDMIHFLVPQNREAAATAALRPFPGVSAISDPPGRRRKRRTDPIWRHAGPTGYGGWRLPDLAMTIVDLACRAARSDAERGLPWLVDLTVASDTRSVDWESVIRIAGRRGVRAPVRRALSSAQTRLDAQVPQWVDERLGERRLTRLVSTLRRLAR